MNDTATHQDPFIAIQSTEEHADKSIEKVMHKQSEALSGARLERDEALKAYEEELKNEGMQKLKEVKEGTVQKQNAELASARNAAETLKANAKSRMNEAIKLIIDKFQSEGKKSS